MATGGNNPDKDSKRVQFGNRRLTDARSLYDHNAWDDVEWTEDLLSEAENRIAYNSSEKLSLVEQEKYEKKAPLFWDKFYEVHQDGFFKDRHWLFTEFPELSVDAVPLKKKGSEASTENVLESELCSELSDVSLESSQVEFKKNFLEVGCGVGNTVFPILKAHNHGEVFLYCCDFSETAISIIKKNPNFDPLRCHPFVLDITADSWNVPFLQNSLDCIMLIFVLSAIHPDKLQNIITTLVRYLKPGGKILFRDYGKYDMVQLRFKPGQCLADRFYVRRDGTRVYFFTKDEVHNLFSNAGLIEKQLLVDHRLQVNRGKMLTMYRVWVQAIYMKPELCAT